MKGSKFSILTAALVLVLGIVAVFQAAPATASAVEPIFVEGNPSCSSLGYGFGFKLNQSPNGTFTLISANGELTGGAPEDPTNSVTISNSDGMYFDWAATLGIDGVIVKGGPDANFYAYSPEALSDIGLHAPINAGSGEPYGTSHIEFCYDYELTASKTADALWYKDIDWTIEKDVSPALAVLFAGESEDFSYDVTLTKVVNVGPYVVQGSITVNNPTPYTVALTVSDLVNGTPALVECPTYSLAPGASTACTYSVELGGKFDGTNVATITSLNPVVQGATAQAPYAFGDPILTGDPDTINVTDTLLGDLGAFSSSDSVSYDVTQTCSSDPAAYTDGFYSFAVDNTATIVETGEDDSEMVTIDCYAPVVSKDAQTSFTRTWDWTIDKSADQTDLLLSAGQLFQVNYEVTVDATYIDSDWKVEGTITVHNPRPDADMTVSLADVVSPDIAATLDCGGLLLVPAGGSATCDYSADLPDGSDRTNTATATLNGIGFDGSADVLFGDPTAEIDECIDVDDTNVGFLGTVCADQAPQSFSYSLWFGQHADADVYLECGDNSHINIASFETNDTFATGSDSWTVNANVACEFGCSLTPGYWKTHSMYGPAPYDATWALIGEDTPFFLSGQSYYQVLWTSPAGNAYYILAHAYIAAELNFLNGSDPSAAQAAFDAATVLFETYTPEQVAGLKGAARAQFINLAQILDDYNNGLIGPGHCSE